MPLVVYLFLGMLMFLGAIFFLGEPIPLVMFGNKATPRGSSYRGIHPYTPNLYMGGPYGPSSLNMPLPLEHSPFISWLHLSYLIDQGS